MNNKQMKKATVDAINVMIRHADKGPSGFWVEDHEGCGNPAVFPEFEEGLKRGRLVQKEHYFCPWNTAIMYGDGHGNINTGCYHSCSISKARYLTTEELKEVLAPMGNIAGTVMDEYSDEVYHKFTDKLEKKADEIQEDNPKKAEQLRVISKSFKEAVSLERIIGLLKFIPSSANKSFSQILNARKYQLEQLNNLLCKIT